MKRLVTVIKSVVVEEVKPVQGRYSVHLVAEDGCLKAQDE